MRSKFKKRNILPIN